MTGPMKKDEDSDMAEMIEDGGDPVKVPNEQRQEYINGLPEWDLVPEKLIIRRPGTRR
jgi:hypothetical protein